MSTPALHADSRSSALDRHFELPAIRRVAVGATLNVLAALGAVFAAAVFATSAIAVPMLVDRRVDIATAVATSLKAMRVNPAAMAAWALALVVLMLLAFATLPLGVMVLFPWAAHASWHAYRGMTRQ